MKCLLFLFGLLFFSGCVVDYSHTVPDNFPSSFPPVNRVVHVQPLYVYANTFADFRRTGLCYDFLVNSSLDGRPLCDNPDSDGFCLKSKDNYGLQEFGVYSDADAVVFVKIFFPRINQTNTFSFYNMEYFSDIPVNVSFNETYDCYFKGRLMSSNNTYEELSNKICDEYKVYCGDY